MKKFIAILAIFAIGFAAHAAITTDYDYDGVIPGVELSEGDAVSNVVNTAGAIGRATFVVPYQLAAGGRLDVEFSAAITNGAPFISCPTNGASLLASYSITSTNATAFKVSYPAVNVPGRLIRVTIRATTGASKAGVVFAAWKQK